MRDEDFIEIENYEDGRWITRRYPRSVAVGLFQQLAQALGEPAYLQQVEPVEGRLKVLVE